MALDFKLNLILPKDNHTIFSRGAIEMTINIVKPHNPAIAARLRAILCQPPLPTSEEEAENPHQHMFQVSLAPPQIKQICDIIHTIIEDKDNDTQPGVLAVAKALFNDWSKLMGRR